MAIEAERLLATFEARFSSLEKAFAKARTDSAKTFGSIEADGTRAEKALEAIGARSIPGITRATAAIKTTRIETGNLAAQFQDIAVQLQGGGSPFTVALQQGTQIAAVLGPLGARGAVSALGGAFASLVSPVSLATVGIITLGGVALQYFSTLFEGGEKSAEVLRQEADLIQRVADKWGEALPALKAYADQRQALADAADRDSATQAAISAEYTKASQQLATLQINLQGVLADMGGFVGQVDNVRKLQDAFSTLDRKVKDHTATAEDARVVQQLFADVLATTGIKSVEDQTEAVNRLTAALEAANASSLKLATSFGPLGGNTIAKGKTSRFGRTLDDGDAVNVAFRTNSSLFEEDEKPQKPKRDREAEAAERQRQAVKDLISDLEFERDLIGLTDVEREKEIALRQAGAAATDEQRDYIGQLVEQRYAEQLALRELNKEMEFQKDLLDDALTQLRGALEDGKLSWEEMGDVALNVLDRILDKLQGELLDAIFNLNNAGSGGILSSLLAGLFGGVSLPSRAPVPPSRPMASGGRVVGPGTGTSDSIHAMLSNGEYVVKADAARRHGPLLDAINGGGVAHMAGGGPVGRGGSGGAYGPNFNLQIIEAGRDKAQVQSVDRQPNGDVLVKMLIGEVKRDYGRGGFDKLNAGRFGLKPTVRAKG